MCIGHGRLVPPFPFISSAISLFILLSITTVVLLLKLDTFSDSTFEVGVGVGVLGVFYIHGGLMCIGHGRLVPPFPFISSAISLFILLSITTVVLLLKLDTFSDSTFEVGVGVGVLGVFYIHGGSNRSTSDTVQASEKNVELRTLEEGPDGGFGWFVVLGAFFVQVTSFGTATSWICHIKYTPLNQHNMTRKDRRLQTHW
ncbi:hypothetical protein BD770DRAFT_431637 [Pilaira anomala]|nr:hypothetical protein BD770DRAFT_431637 [Pilaira anomala]